MNEKERIELWKAKYDKLKIDQIFIKTEVSYEDQENLLKYDDYIFSSRFSFKNKKNNFLFFRKKKAQDEELIKKRKIVMNNSKVEYKLKADNALKKKKLLPHLTKKK